MNKYLTIILSTALVNTALAATVDYGNFSQQYNECIQKIPVGNNYMEGQIRCETQEYYRLKQEINALQKSIGENPLFSEYNKDPKLSLPQNIKLRENYIDNLCKVKIILLENKNSEFFCKLDEMNNLYVDLYKIAESLKTKK